MSSGNRTKRVGRPRFPRGIAKKAAITLRVCRDEAEQYSEAARKQGIPRSEWIRRALNVAARRGIIDKQ